MSGPTGNVRIPLPSRVSWPHVVTFVVLLVVLELLAGTSPPFALLIGCFVILAGYGFNLAGGLTTSVGVGLTMLTLKIVIISQVAKVVLWQPADSFLEAPLVTAAVLALGLTSIVVGLRYAGDPRRYGAWLRPLTHPRSLRLAAMLMLAIGGGASFFVIVSGTDTGAEELRTGGLVGIARQFTFCLPLSTVLATAAVLQRTARRAGADWLVATSMLAGMTFGVIGGTKSGLFEPILYFGLTCAAWRYEFRRSQIVGFVLAAALAVLVVWPVMQTLKTVGGAKVSFGERVEVVVDTLSSMSSISELVEAKANIEEMLGNERFEYYGTYIGWLDRFSLIEQDDELVAATLDQGALGAETITHAVFAMIPSALYPNKPTRNTAGLLGRYAGITAPDDEDTQISFGIIAEAFTCFEWLGVLLLPGLLIVLFCYTTGRLSGVVYENVWTVFLVGRVQHYFVESTISAFIQEAVVGSALLYIAYRLSMAISRGATAAEERG